MAEQVGEVTRAPRAVRTHREPGCTPATHSHCQHPPGAGAWPRSHCCTVKDQTAEAAGAPTPGLRPLLMPKGHKYSEPMLRHPAAKSSPHLLSVPTCQATGEWWQGVSTTAVSTPHWSTWVQLLPSVQLLPPGRRPHSEVSLGCGCSHRHLQPGLRGFCRPLASSRALTLPQPGP